MAAMCEKDNLSLLIAPKKYCTDNAVMVASLAYYKYQAGQFADMTLEPKATSD
jgi:N6-L-threonylcarbamoyladenine synthase